MTTETSSTTTRRALLGAAIGGAAAVAAAAAPRVARAADGGNAILGVANTSNEPTSFENQDPGEPSLVGLHAAAGLGVTGQSQTGIGVMGASMDNTPTVDFGVTSHKTGVMGTAGLNSSMADNTDETGVYGFADLSAGSTGVWGDSTLGYGVFGTGYVGAYGTGVVGAMGDVGAGGVGVYGFSGDEPVPEPSRYGVGVYARAGAGAGLALFVEGKALFSRSKRISIGASKTSVKVTLSGVTTSSYILATLQTSISGCYVRAVVPASGSFTIYLSKAPGKTAYIGYLVIN